MGWISKLSIWLMFLHLFNMCTCLKDLKIYVPEAVANGDAVTLSCYYNLENASLYSVRWYFEQEEFYRFVPKESPPSRVFAVTGISVDLSKSGEHTVTLRAVSRVVSGKYQCEVSADAPLFHTETSTAEMLVAELPAHKPIITVHGTQPSISKKVIAIGELLKANCVSGSSYPPVNFTWIINGNIFPSNSVGLRSINGIEENTSIAESTNKEAWSELIVRIDNHMLLAQSRKILIRCETNIYNLYRGAAEAELRLSEDSYWLHGGGKVSPTTDQRSSSSSSKGDPDNSALQAGAVHLFGSRKISLFVIVQALIIWRINSLLS